MNHTTITSETPAITGRTQLQHVLDQGREGLALQLRYLLMVCQVVKARPVAPEAPLTLQLNDTRLDALTEIAGQLTAAQREILYNLIAAVPDEGQRLAWWARAIREVGEGEALVYARTVWGSVEMIRDPALRAGALLDIAEFIHDTHGSGAASGALIRLVRLAQQLKSMDARLRGLIGIAPFVPPQQATELLKSILSELARAHNDTLTTKSIHTLAPALPIQLMEAAIALSKTIRLPVERARALTALTPYVLDGLRFQVRQAALNAIESIEGEDERADTLIALAPYMDSASRVEYPKVLEIALSVAMGMQRRPLRARMLVSLAPHLTADLQVEAIAAVNSLTSERERATLLTTLAPTLPESLIVAGLAVAYAMREQDSRVQALAALARYAPAAMKNQILLDALAAANNLANHFERVRVLVALLEMMPLSMRDQTMTNALESARLIENESARARAINLLGAHLPDALLERALSLSRELENVDHQLNALLGLIPHLPDQLYTTVLHEMQQSIVSMPVDYKRARALAAIAPHVRPNDVPALETLARDIEDPIDRLNVFLALIANLPPRHREGMVQQAYRLLVDAEPGYDKATAIVALAPHLLGDDNDNLLRMIAPTVEAIEDEYDQASAIVILAPLLIGDEMTTGPGSSRWDALALAFDAALAVPYPAQRLVLIQRAAQQWTLQSAPERAFSVWAHMAQRMTSMPIAHVVQLLGALVPLLKDFGGDEATHEVAQLLGIR